MKAARVYNLGTSRSLSYPGTSALATAERSDRRAFGMPIYTLRGIMSVYARVHRVIQSPAPDGILSVLR